MDIKNFIETIGKKEAYVVLETVSRSDNYNGVDMNEVVCNGTTGIRIRWNRVYELRDCGLIRIENLCIDEGNIKHVLKPTVLGKKTYCMLQRLQDIADGIEMDEEPIC